jgi:hypothetical protein
LILSDQEDITDTLVNSCRLSLLSGSTNVPLTLGTTARAVHVERGERDCMGAALPSLIGYIGAAARVIECGVFAGHLMTQILGTLERPKAGVILTSALDRRQFGRLSDAETTAEISHVDHDASRGSWPLELIGAGKTLVVVGGGGFGLVSRADGFAILENASHALCKGDFVLLTLEMVRDGATLDASYADFGKQVVSQAVTAVGRSEGLDLRTFYDAATQSVRFGAIAHKGAFISWNGTRCAFDDGTWLDVGAIALHRAGSVVDLHPDFEIHDQWQSQDKVVTLLLLRKI